MDGVEADAGGRARQSLPAHEQRVEAAVEREQRDGAGADEPRPSNGDAPCEAEGGERAEPVTGAQVERARAAASLEHELRPRKPAAGEVGPHHRGQRPALEVPALEKRVGGDPRSARGEPQAELEVLDGRRRVAVGVEAAGGEEGLTPDRAETGPERLRRPRSLLVHVVVEEVAEARHERGVGGVVVVGAEERVEARVGGEGRADAREGVAVRLHVGVDEQEDVAGRAAGTLVPGGSRPGRRGRIDDDHLLRRLVGGSDRGQAAGERRG